MKNNIENIDLNKEEIEAEFKNIHKNFISNNTNISFQEEKQRNILKKQQLENNNLAQNIELRKLYANKIFSFICIWSLLVFVILGFQGSNYTWDKLYWQTETIIVLITTTFIQVLGLMIIVLKYLFPK